jgi:small subunit ribosomal protein S17
MAESEETTENVEEVSSPATPEATASEETTTADETGTRKERNAAKRAAKATPATGAPRTLEDRLAERAAHRERNARQRRAYRAKQKAKRAEVRAAAPAESEELHAPDHGPGRPKVRQGVVVSSKPDKTITVRVDLARRHKRYHKILRSSVTLHAHDESNNANAGDTVRIQECRPMSRMKRWRLLDVLERAR